MSLAIKNLLEKVNSRSWTSFLFWYLSFFLLSILVRLPHFLSRVFWFDGDEAIVGIMAQDLLAGENFSLYFYGQDYGLTIFESLSVAFWIKILGSGIWALRLGGLTIFTFGIYFLFKGLITRGKTKFHAFLFAMAILCSPTWMIWGALVRGGYVTAFAASFLLFYLISLKNFSWKNVILIAVSLTVIFDSHNLMLFVLAPLLLRDWIANKGSWFKFLIGLFVSIGLYFILHSLVMKQGFMYTPWMDYTMTEFIGRWEKYINGFIHSFGGFYYLGDLFVIPSWWRWLMITALLLMLFLTIRLFVKVNLKDRVFISLWFFGILGLFFICAFPVGYSARYLISVFTGFIFLFAFFDSFFSTSVWNSGIAIVLLMIFLAGIGVGSKQERDWYVSNENCMEAFESLHQEAVNHNVKAVFVTDVMKQWQWNFLYGNEIPANPFGYEERINRFLLAADSIYRKSPESTAIIGNWGIFMRLDTIPSFNETLIQIKSKHFIQPDMKAIYHELGYKNRGMEYNEKKK